MTNQEVEHKRCPWCGDRHIKTGGTKVVAVRPND